MQAIRSERVSRISPHRSQERRALRPGETSPSANLNFRPPAFATTTSYHAPVSPPAKDRFPPTSPCCDPSNPVDQYLSWESPSKTLLPSSSPNKISFYQTAGAQPDPAPAPSNTTTQLFGRSRALYELSTIELARIQKLFAEIDADDDGEISALELESHVTGCEELFKQIDIDNDNEISCYELELFFSKLKMNWGEAALDVILAYLMDNAVKSNAGEPLEILPLAQVFFSAPIGVASEKNGRKKAPALTNAQFRVQVSKLFENTVEAASAILGDGGTLSATAVASVYGPANQLFVDLPAVFTITAWEGVFDRVAASKGLDHASEVLRSCERHLYVLMSCRELLGPRLQLHRVVGVVKATPSKPKEVSAEPEAAASPDSRPTGTLYLDNAELRAVQDLFHVLDLDGSGALDVDEITKCHGTGSLFDQLDLNHDGEVSPNELETFMDQLKGAQGANVLEIVLQYLRMNAEAYRHQGDVTNLPIEGLFLEQFDLPARVTSPDATELSPEDRNCLEAVYDDLSDTSAVNVASVKSVHGRHADPILEQILAGADIDESNAVCISADDWIQASTDLLPVAGHKYVNAIVKRLSKNIENQEMTRGVLQDLQGLNQSPKSPSNPLLENFLEDQL